MKYFLDTEFIEGFHKPLFSKRRHFIDLISIGIVCEDGREYYAISNEFNPKKADRWVLENVLDPMVHDWCMSYSGDGRNWVLDRIERKGKIGAIKQMQKYKGKSLLDILFEVAEFTGAWRDIHFWRSGNDAPEFYGYYCDYDWVAFCSLFGRMIDLPKGFPMYCKDLKQLLDEKAENMTDVEMTTYIIKDAAPEWDIVSPISKSVYPLNDFSFSHKLEIIRAQKSYPKQENEHSAIDDARWNKKLYDFLQTI